MSISGAQRLAAGAAEASVLMNSVLRRLVTEASDLEHISQADVSSVEATPPASVAEKLSTCCSTASKVAPACDSTVATSGV